MSIKYIPCYYNGSQMQHILNNSKLINYDNKKYLQLENTCNLPNYVKKIRDKNIDLTRKTLEWLVVTNTYESPILDEYLKQFIDDIQKLYDTGYFTRYFTSDIKYDKYFSEIFSKINNKLEIKKNILLKQIGDYILLGVPEHRLYTNLDNIQIPDAIPGEDVPVNWRPDKRMGSSSHLCKDHPNFKYMDDLKKTEVTKIDDLIRKTSLSNNEFNFHLFKIENKKIKLYPKHIRKFTQYDIPLLEEIFEEILTYVSKQCYCMREQIYVSANPGISLYFTAIYSHSYSYYEYFPKKIYRQIDMIFLIDGLKADPDFWSKDVYIQLIRKIKKSVVEQKDVTREQKDVTREKEDVTREIATEGNEEGCNTSVGGSITMINIINSKINKTINEDFFQREIKVILCKKFISGQYILLCSKGDTKYILYLQINNRFNRICSTKSRTIYGSKPVSTPGSRQRTEQILETIYSYENESSFYVKDYSKVNIEIISCYALTQEQLDKIPVINIDNPERDAIDDLIVDQLITQNFSNAIYPSFSKTNQLNKYNDLTLINTRKIKLQDKIIDNPLHYNNSLVYSFYLITRLFIPDIVISPDLSNLDNFTKTLQPFIKSISPDIINQLFSTKLLFPCIYTKTSKYYVLTTNKRTSKYAPSGIHLVTWFIPINDTLDLTKNDCSITLKDHPDWLSCINDISKLDLDLYKELTIAMIENIKKIHNNLSISYLSINLDTMKVKTQYLKSQFNHFIHKHTYYTEHVLHVNSHIYDSHDPWNLTINGLSKLNLIFNWENIGLIINNISNYKFFFNNIRLYNLIHFNRYVPIIQKYGSRIDQPRIDQQGGSRLFTSNIKLTSVKNSKDKLYDPDTYYYIINLLILLNFHKQTYIVNIPNKYLTDLITTYNNTLINLFDNNKYIYYNIQREQLKQDKPLIIGTVSWLYRHFFKNPYIIEDYPFFNYISDIKHKEYDKRLSVKDVHLYNTFDTVYIVSRTGDSIYRLLFIIQSIWVQFEYTIVADGLLFLKNGGTLIWRYSYFKTTPAIKSLFAIMISLFDSYNLYNREDYTYDIYFHNYKRPDNKTLEELTNNMKQLNINNPLPSIEDLFKNLAYHNISPWILEDDKFVKATKQNIKKVKYYKETFTVNSKEILDKVDNLIFEIDKYKTIFNNKINLYGRLIESKKMDNALIEQEVRNTFLTEMRTAIIFARKNNIPYNHYYDSYFVDYITKINNLQNFNHKYYLIASYDDTSIDTLDITRIQNYINTISQYKKHNLTNLINNSRILLLEQITKKFNLDHVIDKEFVKLYEIIYDTHIMDPDDSIGAIYINDTNNIAEKVVKYYFKKIINKQNLLICRNITNLESVLKPVMKLSLDSSCIIQYSLEHIKDIQNIIDIFYTFFLNFTELIFIKPFSSELDTLEFYIICKNKKENNKTKKYLEHFVFQIYNFFYNFTSNYIEVLNINNFITECKNPLNRMTDELTKCNLVLENFD